MGAVEKKRESRRFLVHCAAVTYRNISPYALGLSLSLGVAACSKQPPPLTASSAGQGGYALGYVESLSAARQEVATIESQVETARSEFPRYPDALSNPSWPDVLTVYTAADESGRSADYVQELEKDEVVARFYTDEKDELNKKVGGAAQQAAKQKGCDVDLYGPTSYALGKAFEKRLQERMRSHSEAHRYLDDHEDALGKTNRPKLEDQIDAIAKTSYLARVAIVKVRDRLAEQVNEASQVDKTLQRVAEDAHRVAADPKTPEAQRTRANEEEQAANNARQRLAPEVNGAKKLVDEMDQHLKAVREKYETTFGALRQSVQSRTQAK